MSIVDSGVLNENSSDDDIPDNFFNELADAEFIEELVESAQDGEPDMFNSGGSNSQSRENSPRMARCLAEIDVLTKDIERRKKKLEKELSQKGLSEQDLRNKLDRDIDADDERRSHRNRRGRDDRRPSRSPTRSRSRSRRSKSKSIRSPPYRERQRDHHRRHQNKSPPTIHRRHGRRGSHSPTPNGKRRSSSTHKNLSFLEELAKTFAAQGKPFHEADILAQAKSGALEQPASMPSMLNPVGDPNMMPMQINNMQQFPPTMPTHINPIVYPNVGYPTNMYYGMDGLSTNAMAGINSGPPMMQSAHMNRNATEVGTGYVFVPCSVH